MFVLTMAECCCCILQAHVSSLCTTDHSIMSMIFWKLALKRDHQSHLPWMIHYTMCHSSVISTYMCTVKSITPSLYFITTQKRKIFSWRFVFWINWNLNLLKEIYTDFWWVALLLFFCKKCQLDVRGEA